MDDALDTLRGLRHLFPNGGDLPPTSTESVPYTTTTKSSSSTFASSSTSNSSFSSSPSSSSAESSSSTSLEFSSTSMWDSIIKGLSVSGDIDGALVILSEMRDTQTNFPPTINQWQHIINAVFEQLGVFNANSSQKVKNHGIVMKYDPMTLFYQMYNKDKVKPTLPMYHQALTIYAMLDQPSKVIEVFRWMKYHNEIIDLSTLACIENMRRVDIVLECLESDFKDL